MILLISGAGDGIHAGGMGMHLIFRYDGGGGILADHVSGIQPAVRGQKGRQPIGKSRVHQSFQTPFADAAKLAGRDAHIVKKQCHGLAVKISAGNDAFILRIQDRIVRNGVDLYFQLILGIVYGIPDGTVHLRHAAQGISILYPQIPAGFHGRTAGKEPEQVGRRAHLPLMGANGMKTGFKSIGQAVKRFHGHGSSDVRQ